MTRDMDFVRELLLSFEAGNNKVDTFSKQQAINTGFKDGRGLDDGEAEKLKHHLEILDQEKFITINKLDHYGYIKQVKLTWSGHDMLDAIRDPETWQKTKEGALAAGGWTFGLLQDLAKGLIKKKIEEATGVAL